MKIVAILFILLVATSALAADTIGFYFDSDAASNIGSTTTPGELIMGYLVMNDASHQESIGQWRGNVDLVAIDGDDPTIVWQYPGSMYNIMGAPEFDVRTLNPLPWAEDFLLATAYITVPDPDIEVEVLISAPRDIELFSNGNFPVRQPVYSYSADYIQAPLTQTSGSSYQPVALINDNGIPVPWPTLTIHTHGGVYGDVVLGDQVWGAMRSFFYLNQGLADRPLEAIMTPKGNGTFLRQIHDMYSPWGGYIFGDSPDPVWVVMESGEIYQYPSMLWHSYADTVGENQEYGLDIVFGDQIQTVSRTINVYPDPCITRLRHGWSGEWETSWDETPFDLGWTPVGVTRDYYVLIRNIREPELLLEAEFSGSSAFILMNYLPESVPGESSHTVLIRFAPETAGVHEASLTWGNEICETVNLMGIGRVSSASPLPHAGESRLLNNYPNPFNPSTKIAFELVVEARVEINIFDAAGRHVRTLLAEDRPAGYHEVHWDGNDSQGQACASGVYFSRLETGEFQDVGRMTLVR